MVSHGHPVGVELEVTLEIGGVNLKYLHLLSKRIASQQSCISNILLSFSSSLLQVILFPIKSPCASQLFQPSSAHSIPSAVPALAPPSNTKLRNRGLEQPSTSRCLPSHSYQASSVPAANPRCLTPYKRATMSGKQCSQRVRKSTYIPGHPSSPNKPILSNTRPQSNSAS